MFKSVNAAFCGAMICALSASIGVVAAPAAAATLPAQSWNGYKWAHTGKLQIQVGSNLTADWVPFVQTAAAQWSADPTIDYVMAAGRAGGGASVCNPVYGTLQVCNGNYGASGWVGYTQVWTIGTQIVQATIKLNEYYFSQAKYNTAAYRTLVACQELGNALGLQDADRNFKNANLGSCTDYTNDPSGTKGTNGTLANIAPSASDLTNLNMIYSVLDKTQLAQTRPTATAGNGFAAVPEPASWATMLGGFGLLGGALRAQRRRVRVGCA